MSKVQSAWSRRKAAVAAEAVAEDRAVEDAVIAEQHEALAEKTDVEILEELGLPDPDAMVQGDDFKAFSQQNCTGTSAQTRAAQALAQQSCSGLCGRIERL